MLRELRPALILAVSLTVLTGLAYPLAMTGFAGALFPADATGSLIERDGRVICSALIAQPFARPEYLHPRPSAADWNADPSGASNLGPTSATLLAQVQGRQAAYEARNGASAPVDAVTASGSGLDPHVSPANARAQAARIARARGLDEAAVRRLIEAHVEPPLLGLWGQARVNVLAVNLALDAAGA